MQTNIQRFPLCIIRVDMSIQHENFCCWQYVFFVFVRITKLIRLYTIIALFIFYFTSYVMPVEVATSDIYYLCLAAKC